MSNPFGFARDRRHRTDPRFAPQPSHQGAQQHLDIDLVGLGPWDRSVDGSRNRLDAAIWALTRLSKIVTNIPIA
jgi:phage terminase large subunit-like protein